MSVVQGAGRRTRGSQDTNERKVTAAATTVLTQKASSRLQPLKTHLPAQGPTAVQRGEVTDGLGPVTGLPAAN